MTFQSLAKAVTVAGTAEPISSTSLVVQSATIQADPENAGNVYLGGTDVDLSNGVVLEPGKAFNIPVRSLADKGGIDLQKVYIDAATSGDEVRVAYIKNR